MDRNEFSPDGLTEDAIDALIRDVADELADESAELAAAMLALVDAPTLKRTLLDGTALARRQRREVQRQLDSTVRVLRAHGFMAVPSGTEAA